MWQELGAIAGRNVFVHNEIFHIEAPDGKKFIVPTELDEIERQLKLLSPEDAALIEHASLRMLAFCACGWNRRIVPFELLSFRERTCTWGCIICPLLRIVLRWKNLSLGDYLKRYQSPFLRRILKLIAGQ